MKNTFLAVILFLSSSLHAAELNLPNSPLFVQGSKTALVQIVMERDNKLFFEAYPSYEDINNDGVIDIGFKPDEIDYYGYFESNYCYQVVGGDHLEPVSHAVDKKCSGAWSGDFLNYTTMTRMDVVLRALYGGKRLIDTATETRLRRAFVPWENHTWGIEYTSVAKDGYDISDYAPMAIPIYGRRHLFSTSNVMRDDVPYLRVRVNTDDEIWQWVDKERTQGDGYADFEIQLDVTVCSENFIGDSCQQYPNGQFKPVGLLHEYGENNSMYFGLMTGSFENNLQGGVLRKEMSSFGENEINPTTGQFTRAPGIVTTLDAIQIPNDWRWDTVQQDCGWISDRAFVNGECKAWGNPLAEIMYEGMRYFAGEVTPTPEFDTSGGMDGLLGLPTATWDDPYSGTKEYPQCSGAYQLVVSDPSPTFDSDQLPGSYFANFTSSSLGSLHVGDLADFISSNEPGIPGLKFIGQVGGFTDGAPSPKMVDSFRNIRGQSPESPHREGGYYASSVAYYGHQNDLHSTAPGDQTVGNFTLALGSPMPTIDIDVNNNKISFAPFSVTVDYCSNTNGYAATNPLMSFTIEELNDTTGSFRVSYENMAQGGDNDSDAVARYNYEVKGNIVTMTVDATLSASATCGIQHIGYVVSGSTKDGVHLVVRDDDTTEAADIDYLLDVPPGASPGVGWNDGLPLPKVSSVDFTPSSSPRAEPLESPLWYAAKWGGFDDRNEDGIPQKDEWDANDDGLPDNYFPVSDPSRMKETMRTVFSEISEEIAATTSVSTSAGSLRLGNKIYRSVFTSGSWTGDVVSQTISAEGKISAQEDWSANEALKKQIDNGTRQIITYNPVSERGVAFRWPDDVANLSADELSAAQLKSLGRNPITDKEDDLAEDRLAYLRGESNVDFRDRKQALGDIIGSSPILVGAPTSPYPDTWGAGAPENNAPYSDYRKQHKNRQRVTYVGANDGMLHAFDAGSVDADGQYTDGTGRELFAYIPSPGYAHISDLTDEKYSHKYFVDSTPRASDVFINGEWRSVLIGGLGRGGQGIYALDVTRPDLIDENTAQDTVLWEFLDRDEADLGYTFQTPIIARMANGKWNAIIANGYNNSTSDVGYARGSGWSSVLVIDIETGQLVRKLFGIHRGCIGNQATPNAMSEPSAIDLDGDNIVDVIYAGDLQGCVYRFDVSSRNPLRWGLGELKHVAEDNAGNALPITTRITVGSHPSGTGVMLFFGTGKYLEPSDQTPATTARRLYGIWDKGRSSNARRTRISAGNMLEQYITSETIRDFDNDDDGVVDVSVPVRETSEEVIDWSQHLGWYMDLFYNTVAGEQVIASPILRDGKIYFSTHIPTGDECDPDHEGWLMTLDARSGAMLDKSPVDINKDGEANDGRAGGVGGLINPFASPTIVAGENTDFILTQDEKGAAATKLSVSMNDGRITWREIEP